ncbi:MAG: hypothetical protein JXB46_00250, partial [Candidatus Eisenbacteria bacterium]|nr:hypothetical protein [Candidatus Eisenbacteria bacterium]
MSLVLVILMLGLAASYLTVSTSNSALTLTSRDTLQALYVAETGLARAFHELNVENTAAFQVIDNLPCPTCGQGPTRVATGNPDMPVLFTFESPDHALCQRIPGSFPQGTHVFTGTYSVTKTLAGEAGSVDVNVDVGMFSVAYVERVPDEEVKLISVGQFNRSRRCIEVVLHKPEPTDPPAFFEDFAWYSRRAIEIKGNVDINGDVYTGENCTISGNAYSVDDSGYTDAEGTPTHPGNLTAVEWISGNTSHVSGEVTTGAPLIEAPTFDVAEIVQAAQDAGMEV